MTSRFEDPGFFGELWADDYDDGAMEDPGPAADFLAVLAGDGRALELAIGTGRVALPLAARGVDVDGVEASAAMVGRLRAKPGGERIPVTVGDMADVPVEGPYRLVFLVFNTFFNLTSQQRQLDCLRNVARVLEPGGAFVVECYVPEPAERAGWVDVLDVSDDAATIEVCRHDRVAQTIRSQKITFTADGVRLRPHLERYCRPAEIDAMARVAGLEPEARYADWAGAAFTAAAARHVTVYRKGQAGRTA